MHNPTTMTGYALTLANEIVANTKVPPGLYSVIDGVFIDIVDEEYIRCFVRPSEEWADTHDWLTGQPW